MRRLIFLLISYSVFSFPKANAYSDNIDVPIDTLDLIDTLPVIESSDIDLSYNDLPGVERRKIARHERNIQFIHPYKFFENSKEFNFPRTITAGLSIGAFYAGASAWWSSQWYSDYPRGRFHFFDDNGEWLQMDKASHAFNAYFLTRWGHNIFRWSGVHSKNAPWIGMLIGNLWQLSIEVNDGFSKEWGFSWGDMGANFTGSLIFGLQEYFWKEQKFYIKISAAPEKYPSDPILNQRAKDLYGTSIGELILKDYNAITIWMNATPGSFI
ncbi:MAG: YfiM family protein, partial [Chitinophagales bacterium]|nr:YfiM family protein [Chitinophagales bacterium]